LLLAHEHFVAGRHGAGWVSQQAHLRALARMLQQQRDCHHQPAAAAAAVRLIAFHLGLPPSLIMFGELASWEHPGC